jgi:hypothetical protein
VAHSPEGPETQVALPYAGAEKGREREECSNPWIGLRENLQEKKQICWEKPWFPVDFSP